MKTNIIIIITAIMKNVVNVVPNNEINPL